MAETSLENKSDKPSLPKPLLIDIFYAAILSRQNRILDKYNQLPYSLYISN